MADFSAAYFDIENLACTRAGRLVLSHLSLGMQSGECLAITGQNGSGKTTLLRAIAGLLPLESGAIVLKIGEAHVSLVNHLHFVGATGGVKTRLTAAENLTFWAELLGGNDTQISPALRQLDLDALADFPASTLSAGQIRRLSLARLLIAPRLLWLLDEPFTALDERSRILLTTMMQNHLHAGGMIIAATHEALPLQNVKTVHLGNAA